jgi:hypothetical protein
VLEALDEEYAKAFTSWLYSLLNKAAVTVSPSAKELCLV